MVSTIALALTDSATLPNVKALHWFGAQTFVGADNAPTKQKANNKATLKIMVLMCVVHFSTTNFGTEDFFLYRIY